MKAPRFEKDVFIRTTALAKLALESALAKLRARGILKLKGQKTLSQEAFVSALWLALDGLPPEKVEQMLEPEFRRLDKILASRADVPKDSPSDGSDPPVPVIRGLNPSPQKRKRG